MDEHDERLKDIFGKVGKEYGFSPVDAYFTDFNDLKVKWYLTQFSSSIVFTVSDYLRSAPDDILEKLATTLCRRIAGKRSRYPKALEKWITSEDFRRINRATYLERCRTPLCTAEGKHRNLQESAGRVAAMGIFGMPDDVYLSWARFASRKNLGMGSVAMRVALISDQLDRDDIPDYALDWAVFLQLARIAYGINTDGNIDIYMEEMKERFPMADEAREWIRVMAEEEEDGEPDDEEE